MCVCMCVRERVCVSVCVCVCAHFAVSFPGQTNDLLASDCHADQLPRGKHSTKGLGSVAPDPTQTKTLYVIEL